MFHRESSCLRLFLRIKNQYSCFYFYAHFFVKFFSLWITFYHICEVKLRQDSNQIYQYPFSSELFVHV